MIEEFGDGVGVRSWASILDGQTREQAARTARSAKGAAAPLNQSREALLAAWPLHSPEGGQSAAVFAAD